MTKEDWLATIRKKLIGTLPPHIVVDENFGVSTFLKVEFVNKKWIVGYYYQAYNGSEPSIKTKSKSLFKAVWKTHKKILSLCRYSSGELPF